MPSSPDLCPCSPSPSTISSSSTPTEILAARFDSLDQEWSAHKAQSPIKIRKGDPDESAGGSMKSGSTKSTAPLHLAAKDDDSVGQCSVSTLGSTESVFERLYRQRKPVSKSSQGNDRKQDTRFSSSRSVGGGGKFPSPAPSRIRQSGGFKNRKDHLGAYSSARSVGYASVGYNDRTPLRRTRRNSSHHKDTCSVASSLSGGSGFDGDDNSVFARLYRNEKRSEKLWRKPKAFVPTLSSSKQKNKNKALDKSGDSVKQKILFPDGKKDEEQQPQHSRTHEINSVPPKKSCSGLKIDTVLEDDSEDIDHLGKLTNFYEGCTPTVGLTTVASMSWDESPDSRRHSNGSQLKSVEITTASIQGEVDTLDAGSKQSIPTESDEQSLIGSKIDTSCHEIDLQDQNFATQNNAGVSSKGGKDALEDHPSSRSDCEELKANKALEILPASTHETVTSTTHFTENCDFFSLHGSSRSFSADNNFFVERIDRLSSPIRRRKRERLDNKTCYEFEANFTPHRIRSGSAITIQRAFRSYRAEFQLVSAMVQSWSADVKLLEMDENPKLFSIHRELALRQALRGVKCWWILEGLHVEDNWITLAWENELCVGDDIRVQVNLTCEAKSLLRISRCWEPTKLAVLLAKVVLFKAIQHEQASEIEILFERDNRNEHEVQIDTKISPCPVNDDDEIEKALSSLTHGISFESHDISFESHDISFESHDVSFESRVQSSQNLCEEVQNDVQSNEKAAPPLTHDINHDSRVQSSQNLCEEVENEVQSLSTSPRLDDRRSKEKHAAAIKIQSFVRLTMLKSAIKEWPSTASRLRAALETAGPPPNHQLKIDSVDAARTILRSSTVDHKIDGNTKMPSEDDLISQRAAALAIHNIVRTYVAGLTKYREKKRATLIQATFRGYRTRKRLELEDLSALAIQLAWSDRRYIRIRERNATKIQAQLRKFLCQKGYEMHRFCIIFIQAGWRRAIARRRFASLRSSITAVQSVWRGSKDRERYLKCLSAIRSIQYLCKVQHTITTYKNECEAAVMLQSWWRMQCPQMILLRSVKAATCLQAHFRSYIQCREFRKVQFDSIMIQRTWRAYSGAKRFDRQKTAAVCLQTFCRARVRRIKYQLQCQAIRNIQRVTRGCLCRQKMLLYKDEAHKALVAKNSNGAIVIQKMWRGSVERKRYAVFIQSIVLLQKIFRRVMTQSLYKKKITSCQTIQSWLKRISDKSRTQKANLASIEIQRIWRARLASKYVTSLRMKLTASSIKIQSTWRGARVRIAINKIRIATVSIQAFCRKISAKKSLEGKIQDRALTLIQSHLRGAMARDNYTLARISAIMIQASVRQMLSLKHTEKLRNQCSLEKASTLIQSHWRRAKAHEDFEKARVSAIIIQSSVRRRIGSKLLQALRNKQFSKSAVMIQTNWRGAMARDTLSTSRGSAIMIQACVRRVLASRTKTMLKYKHLADQSSILIQSNWRGAMARDTLSTSRGSAILIQACVRRVLASRTKTMLKYKHLADQSSILIQSNWRGAMARDTLSTSRGSAILIQACVRRMLASRTKIVLESKHLADQSSILIQSAWRGAMARSHFNESRSAVILIQALVRRMLASRTKTALESKHLADQSSILIQSAWRGAMARSHFNESRSAVILIQALVRRMLASRTKTALESKHLADQSSILIQSAWRGAMARSYFNESRSAVILIQACVRRMLASRTKTELEYKHLADQSSILIQSAWRGAMARSHFNESCSAAIIIQTAFRRMLCLKEIQNTKTRTQCLVLIQSNWRGAIARDQYSEIRVAATTIQSSVRGLLARSRFDVMVSSLVLIQRVCGAYIARNKFLRLRTAAVCIQQRFRSYRMKMHQVTINSAVLIQSLWRRVIARSILNAFKASSISIQCIMRGYLTRKQLKHSHALATKIQRRWKIMQRVRHENNSELATLIQSCWRSSKARYEYTQYRASTIIIQAAIRGWHARSQFKAYRASIVSVQSIARGFLARRYLNDTELQLWNDMEAATYIQSQWRGALARSKFMQYRVAAMIIQSMVRGASARCKYMQFRVAAMIIQSMVRGALARCKYMQIRVAAMIIQSMVRGAHVRSQWGFVRSLAKKKRILNGSARKIQIAYIAWRIDIELWEMRSLAVLLQRGIRGHLARSVVQYALLQVNSSRNSSIMNSRGCLVHSPRAKRITTWNIAVSGTRESAAIVIQSFVRRFLVRNLISDKFGLEFENNHAIAMTTDKYQSSAIVIQRSFIVWSKSRNCAAIKIQKAIRRWIAWKDVQAKIALASIELKVKAATKIQNLQRRQKLKGQSLKRRAVLKRQFSIKKRAVLKIQTLWRRRLAQMVLEDMKAMHHLAMQTRAITKIQNLQRCRKQKQLFLLKKQAVLKIQTMWRRRLAQMVLEDMKARHHLAMQTRAITKIQNLQRCRKEKQHFLLKKQAVLKIQTMWHRRLAQMVLEDMKAMHHLAMKTRAITKIQNLQRCRKQKQHFLLKKQAVLKIQTMWRRILAQVVLEDMKAMHHLAMKTRAITQIQNLQRCRKQTQHFLLKKQAVLKIQTMWRRILAQVFVEDVKDRRYLAAKTRAAIKIQAFKRYQKQRLNFILKKRIVIRIQNLWRAVLARKSFVALKTAASLVQVKYRDYQLRKVRQIVLVSHVVKVQSLIRRAIVQRRKQRSEAKQRREGFVSNQVLSETIAASKIIADGLLTKPESMANTPSLEKLATRVHSTLNEAASFSNEDILDFLDGCPLEAQNGELAGSVSSTLNEKASDSNDFTHTDPLITKRELRLQRLTARVESTLNEASSLSNEDIQDFAHRAPLLISLPQTIQKSDSLPAMPIKLTDTGTPIRSNKVLLVSETSEAKSEDSNPKAPPSEVKTLVTTSWQKLLNSTERIASPIHITTGSFMDRKKSMSPLAKQAIDLMREGRAALQKNRHGTSVAGKKSEVVMRAQRYPELPPIAKDKTPEKRQEGEPVGNKTGIQNFGEIKTPSPIRPEGENLDWDWTSEW